MVPSQVTNPASGATDPLRNALNELERLDPRKACIARLRLVGRLTTDQIAALLGASRASVGHDWCFARAWLAQHAG
ncbi:MAG: hypothetical protein KA354_10615 [Phycisphaerae bacterium]|nr:hypothetical protein [Phycisphaerae bacterium]